MVRCLACLPSSPTGVSIRHTSAAGAAADPEMVFYLEVAEFLELCLLSTLPELVCLIAAGQMSFAGGPQQSHQLCRSCCSSCVMHSLEAY